MREALRVLAQLHLFLSQELHQIAHQGGVTVVDGKPLQLLGQRTFCLGFALQSSILSHHSPIADQEAETKVFSFGRFPQRGPQVGIAPPTLK